MTDAPYALQGYQADIDGPGRYTGQNYEERARTTLAYRWEQVTIPPMANPSDSLKSHIQKNAWMERTVTGNLKGADSTKAIQQPGAWNTCRIVARGNRLQHYINGVLMSDVTDNDPANRKQKGWIGVQVHVGPPMKVEYRNMRLTEW